MIGKKPVIACDSTIADDRLGKIFCNLGRRTAKACKELATNITRNHGRALEIGAKLGTAAVSKNPNAALSTITLVINFYHTGEWLYSEKIV